MLTPPPISQMTSSSDILSYGHYEDKRKYIIYDTPSTAVCTATGLLVLWSSQFYGCGHGSMEVMKKL